jgi:hypothetical protein
VSTLPSASASASASAPASTPPSAQVQRVATRIAIPALLVDLPVIRPPGDENTYPACNVAMYIQQLGQPGEPRATYIYAHAREGMFLPLLERSAEELVGKLVHVWTSDDMLFLYEIYEVRRAQTTLDDAIGATTDQLWLQTSEGPRGTPGKTQVIARPVSSGPADPAEAHPSAQPVNCS